MSINDKSLIDRLEASSSIRLKAHEEICRLTAQIEELKAEVADVRFQMAEAHAGHLKARTALSEATERFQFQLNRERAVHAQTRDKLKEARDSLKSECLEHAETERRKEREAALLRHMYNDAICRWDAAGSCAGAATGVVAGFGFGAVVLAALDAARLVNVGGFILAATVGILVGIVVRTKVYSSLVDEEGEE